MNSRLTIIILITLVFLSQGILAAVHSCQVINQSADIVVDSINLNSSEHHSAYMDHSQHQEQSSSFDCCKTSMHCSMAGCAVFIPNVASKIILPSTDTVLVDDSLLALTNQHPSSLYRPPIII